MKLTVIVQRLLPGGRGETPSKSPNAVTERCRMWEDRFIFSSVLKTSAVQDEQYEAALTQAEQLISKDGRPKDSYRVLIAVAMSRVACERQVLITRSRPDPAVSGHLDEYEYVAEDDE